VHYRYEQACPSAEHARGLDLEDVTMLIDRFISRATRSHLESFLRLAQTITKHRQGILAAIRLGITQGRTEALYNKGVFSPLGGESGWQPGASPDLVAA
jgi:transposase